MANSNRTAGKAHGPQTNARLLALVREAWWFVLIAGAVFLALILFTYHKTDPGW
jgi:S-DNA-T family DNA segregation ATPase FtsK/SpoIIIE